ncbi:MAG: amidohydrolase [Coriobacteriales bacterium]
MTYADTVFRSNYVFTATDNECRSGAVAIKGNRILSVGSDQEVESCIGPDTKIIDCQDKLVMPGFFDDHTHFGDAAQTGTRFCFPLFGAKSADECVERGKAHLAANPDLRRLYGFGWNPENWDDPTMPTKEMLDEVFPDIPVYFQADVAHFIWANTKALEESGISKEQEFRLGGPVKDENGELTGIVYEIPAISPMVINAHDLTVEERMEITPILIRNLNELGVTSVTVVSGESFTNTTYNDYEAYKRLDETMDGGLPLRMNLYPCMGSTGDFDIVRKLRDTYNSPKVKVCGLKQFVDGVPNLHTAFLKGNYADEPVNGNTFFPPETYAEVVTKANAEGFNVKMHAIGDQAVKIAIDAYEASYEKNRGEGYVNCIEHVDLIDDPDIDRAAACGTVMSIQPRHIILNQKSQPIVFGEERMNTKLYRYRSMVDRGCKICIGTDFPCVPIDPMVTVYAAITRADLDGTPLNGNPDEALTLGETLRGYTYGSACACGRGDELGTLEPGKLADLIVIDGPLFGEDPKAILDRKVLLTMVDGNVVFKRE